MPRPTPLTFREFVGRVNPRYRWYRHCEAVADVLERVADGTIKRLMVFMPPRHGKSEEISRLFSAYYLYRFPDRWVGLNSYGQELANTLSRSARDNYLAAGGILRDDAAAIKHWETDRGGGLWAAGVGGPITGKGWHLGIIDDPVKNADEAASETFRARQREWYGSTFYTREQPVGDGEPDGAIIAVGTRWHDQDLFGWLLDQERADDESPERWHVVSLEAIKEAHPPELPATCTAEPDWRQEGDALWPERRPADKLRRIRERLGPYYWQSLFQCRPRPREGGFFKREWFATVAVDRAPEAVVRYWDLAATEGGGDWTAGVRMAYFPGGRFVVDDVVRGRWSPGRRDEVIGDTARRDHALYGGRLATWFEQEPGASGKSAALAAIKMLAGFIAHAEPASGAKVVRAGPLASHAENGLVGLARGDWASTLLDELCDFPTGRHDDQVDAASGAFNKLALVARSSSSVVGGRRDVATFQVR